MRVKNAVETQFLFVFSERRVVFGFWWKFSLDLFLGFGGNSLWIARLWVFQ